MMRKAAFPSQRSAPEALFRVILSKPFADFVTFCGSICTQFATISGSCSAESQPFKPTLLGQITATF